MFRLLRRKIYKPKLFPNQAGKYTHRSNESLDTISSSRDEVMTPNTLDLMNGHAQKDDSSAEVTSISDHDPNYASVDMDNINVNTTENRAASPYENASSASESPLDVIISDLQNVGNINLPNGHISPPDYSLEVNENVNNDNNDLDCQVPAPREPLYSVIKKKKKKNRKETSGLENPILDQKKAELDNQELQEKKPEMEHQVVLNKEESSNNYTKNSRETQELAALLDSIVSEMDIFVSDGSEQSNEELKSYHQTNSLPLVKRKRQKDGDDTADNEKQSKSIPERKVTKLKCESTPNLHRKVKDSEYNISKIGKGHSGYDSDTDANEDGMFVAVDPQKKSVSFNDVVLEFERPRSIYSTGSSDYYTRDNEATDVKKKIPLDDVITTNIDSDSQCGDEDMYRSSSVMSYDLTNGQLYSEPENAEVVAILTDKSRAFSESDDMLSVAAEGDVYSDTETDEDKEEEEIYVSVKVRRHGKSRTALLMVTWFLLGMSSVMPGTVLPYLADHLNIAWEPLSRGMISYGAGYFLGAVLAGIVISVHHASVELLIIVSLIAGGIGIATIPWFPYLLLFCGSNAVQGLGRGLLQVGSHLFLIRLWNENTGVKLVHGLYISMAAGAAIIPQISCPMMQSSVADDIYNYLDGAGVEEILRLNGYDMYVNGSETVLMKKSGSDLLSVTQGYNDSLVIPTESLTPSQKLYILYFIIAVVPVFCGLVFLVFLSYTCVQTCRKGVKDYSHNRKLRKINKLKDKIAQSRDGLNAFPYLNGKPGDSTKSSNKSAENSNRNSLIENGNDNNGDSPVNSDEGKNGVTKNGICNGKTKTSIEASSKDDLDHVIHVTPVKKKVSFRLSFWEKRKLEKKKRRNKKSNSLFLRNKGCSTGALMYLYVFFCLPIATEVVFSYFIYSYAMQCPLAFTEFKASLLLTVFWSFVLISRILIIPLSKVCPPNAIIISCLILNIMTTSILASYGWRYMRILWTFTCLFGFFLGPILPAGFTWANIYLKHTAKCLALSYCLAALGMALFAWTGGMVLQYYGYKAVMYLLVGICVLAFLLFLPTMRFLKASKVFKVKVKTGKDQVYSTSQRTYI